MGTSVSFGDYSPGVLPVTIIVRTAYFAKKKTEDVFEETTEEYTVVAGDNLSKIADNYEGVSYQEIMEENGLTSTVISIGDTLTITGRKKTGEKTSFEKIKNGNVGDEVYIVAEHFGIVNSIQVTLKEQEALLTDGGALSVLQGENEITTIELCEPEEENLKGTHRYAKIKLRPKDDETLEEWREKLGEKEIMGYTDGQRSIPPESYDRMITKEGWEPEYGDAKKSFLSIEVEAQGEGEITYGGTDKSNVFLNKEGEWFELSNHKKAPWMVYAEQEYATYKGINENTTPLKERIKDHYHKSTTLGKSHYGKKSEWTHKVSWCASFVNWCFEQTKDFKETNISGNGSYNSLAFDWTPSNWENGEKCEPFYGAVITLKYSHTAFIVGKNSKANKYVFLGGNQGGKNAGEQQIRYGTVTIGQEKSISKPKNYTVSEKEKELQEMNVNADGSMETTR
ncbi:LysM peptidoglycan-binding domain-containing protein [Sinomicrobium pectinilyticum]|uniref:LysM peptidoglycan-binding domain-containing protein n=1 Tax=Sinomicrobium pectinilyticum TaxID=1084421 RepID=A0A3N0D0W0_SINP1|nr:LysM peptidoglycan-binding domain-containing protein [Sinomicrobium pectinilyticum]RNL69201.1 LysM peptidoglycan-binding domain-containing protein [Sinomicrobium pectinilyticum]